MKKKIVLLTLFLLLIRFSIMPLAEASPGIVTVNHYLHKTSVGTVNTINTQGYTMNTTTSWSGSTQTRSAVVANTSYTKWYFYVYPTLQGTMSHSGTPSAVAYLKSNASVSDLNLVTTINKISSAGSRTHLSNKTTSSVSLSTSYAAKTNTHTSLTATVASTFMLELNITLGGSVSGDFNFTLAYDTAAYSSKLALKVTDPVTVSLTSDQTSYQYREQATMTVTVNDIWGGYDIASAPTITFTTPSGLVGTTTALSTGDSQYTNTYTYSFTPMDEAGTYGAPLGDWTSTASVSDKSTNSYSSSSYSFAWERQDSPGSTDGGDEQPLSVDNTGWLIILVIVVIGITIIVVAQKGKPSRRSKR